MNIYENLPDMDNLPGLQQEIFRMANELRCKVFESVAEQALGRPATPEDAKDFQIVSRAGDPTEHIAYKGKIIGLMNSKQEYQDGSHKITWEFHPIDKTT